MISGGRPRLLAGLAHPLTSQVTIYGWSIRAPFGAELLRLGTYSSTDTGS
jgi:hypothetical protein